MLERVNAARMGLNPDKCTFAVKKGSLLGHKVSADGVEVDPGKVKKILSRKEPRNITEVRSFVAAAQYYKRQFPGFATLAKLLFSLTKKSMDDCFVWTIECQSAFEKGNCTGTSVGWNVLLGGDGNQGHV